MDILLNVCTLLCLPCSRTTAHQKSQTHYNFKFVDHGLVHKMKNLVTFLISKTEQNQRQLS